MSRSKGSAARGKDQKDAVIKVRVSKEFLEHLDWNLQENMLYGKWTRSRFIINAITIKLRSYARDINKIDHDLINRQ